MQPLAKWSVRDLILLLTAATVIPAAALLTFSVYWQYSADERDAAVAAHNLASVSADSVHGFLSDGSELLKRIAQRPSVRLQGAACDPLFAEFSDLNPQFANLSQATLSGHVACSTVPSTNTSVGDTKWFKEVYSSLILTISPPFYDPATKRVISVIAMPVFDAYGSLSGTVQIALDLAKLPVIPGSDKLPSSTVIAIIDSNATLVGRSHDAEKFVGKSLSDVESVQYFLTQKQGSLRSVSSQGIERIFSFTPVSGTDWIAVAGISTEMVLRSAREAALFNIILGSIFLGVVLFFALYIGNLIKVPIIDVQGAVRKVVAGDLQARAPRTGPAEIAEFSEQFNRMLDAIHSSREQLAAAHSELVLLGTCVAHLSDIVIILDALVKRDGWPVIMFVNQAFVSVTGYSREETVGSTTRMLHGAKTDIASIAQLERGFASTEPFCVDIIKYARDGKDLFIELDMIPIFANAGTLTHWISIERNVTARKVAEDRVRKLAYFDALTELPNRELLIDRTVKALAQVTTDGFLGAAIFIDLDNFKTVNDARGHSVGDLLLQHVARRLMASTRQEDTVARLGGDEFVILLTDLSADFEASRQIAMAVADKVRTSLLAPFSIDGLGYSASASIGVALLRGGEQTPIDLLREADTAMYRAKKGGRNRVAFYEPTMQAEVETLLALESDLAQALSRGQMQVHVQTQVDPRGLPAGAELLLRWKHPVRGYISPAQFIPMAEESGAIIDLGAWVLYQAGSVLERLHRDGSDISISVNVSPRQFRHPEFIEHVRRALETTGATPQRLILEVTEGLLIENLEDGIARMAELVAMGLRFSIDDFGTGYSSLAYLKRLPLHELKVDKSFVLDTPQDKNDAAIVKLIIATAKHLGLRVVAEGVEKMEQAEFLLQNGCDLLQGYYFSRPLPLEEWMSIMANASTDPLINNHLFGGESLLRGSDRNLA